MSTIAHPAPRRLASFALASVPGNERVALDQVAASVAALNLAPDRLNRLKTAVAEATMNAIEHGNGGRPDLAVGIEVFQSGAEVVVTITDHGGRNDEGWTESRPKSLISPANSRVSKDPRGWGLFLIRHMVDAMDVTTEGEHRTVRLTIQTAPRDRGRSVAAACRARRSSQPEGCLCGPADGPGSLSREDSQHLRGDQMEEPATRMDIRQADGRTAVIDIRGDVTAASESALMSAYEEAARQGARRLVLNFSGLEYMNSGGIGMLVTLLVRANRQNQQLAAFGLSDHYREIFELTRLDEAITIYDDEQSALAGPAGRGERHDRAPWTEDIPPADPAEREAQDDRRAAPEDERQPARPCRATPEAGRPRSTG